MPNYVRRAEELFGGKEFDWAGLAVLVEGEELSPFKPLLTKIEKSSLDRIMEASKMAAKKTSAQNEEKKNVEKVAARIDFATFRQVDLRVGKIVAAEHLEGADKLLHLKVDIGFEVREIIAGLKLAYEPKELIGRHTIIAANLKPKKMKFGLSDGMLLAAGEGGEDLYLLSPDNGAKPGRESIKLKNTLKRNKQFQKKTSFLFFNSFLAFI